jgi:phenylalanyl-tRNA synthetase beta chain
MKFTLGWLKDHLETDADADEIALRLTSLGLEVESVRNLALGLESFVIGHVVEARPHPNADRLQVCKVDNGTSVIEVVCGAPNARTGLKGVFAADGSYIPGTKITLKKSEIRGVVSNGMLLSEREMGLSDEHDGIIELPDDAPIGTPAVALLGLDDIVIDIDVTPNRGDCLGIRGIARDLAATGIGTLKPLDAAPIKGTFKSPFGVKLDAAVTANGACPYFVGRLIKGVANGDSPDWLKKRLVAVGLRPISALVDITNYMTIGFCRPLHVFDSDKIAGGLTVRLAQAGEKLRALNDQTYDLDPEMTVIADDKGPAALGGVMGGEAGGCTSGTVNVFVESALFDPIRTATTGRKLNLTSDARCRFERGIDATFLEGGMEIATRLIQDICGGEISELVIAGAAPATPPNIELRVERIASLGGLSTSSAEAERILAALGFDLSAKNDVLSATVPPWRSDIVGEACLIEEVLRVKGYDQVPSVALDRPSVLPSAALTAHQRRRVQVRRSLATRGLVEAVTLSFMPSPQAMLFGGASDALMLVNPISSDLDAMRPSILPNLLDACRRNADRGLADAALFEVGPQFAGDAPEDQAMVAAGVRSGSGPRHWSAESRAVDAFDAKADAIAGLKACGLPENSLQTAPDAPAWYHPGHSGSLKLGNKAVAYFGLLHPKVLAGLDVKGPVSGFEILLDALPPVKARKSAAKAHLDLSALQPVSRDFAFVVGDDVAAASLVRAAKGADKAVITSAEVFDVFTGGNLSEGMKSIAFSVTLQPTTATFTDEEIEGIAAKIVAAVSKATGGTLRS